MEVAPMQPHSPKALNNTSMYLSLQYSTLNGHNSRMEQI